MILENSKGELGAKRRFHHQLASVYDRLGKKKEALEQARLAEVQGQSKSASSLATQSDRRQLAIQQEWRHHLDLVLSLEEDAGRAYRLVLGWKGQSFAAQQRRRQLARLALVGIPKVREIVRELQQVSRAMARMT